MGYSATLTQMTGPIVVTRPALVVDMFGASLHDNPNRHGMLGELLRHFIYAQTPDQAEALIGIAGKLGFHAYPSPTGSVLITGWEAGKVVSVWPSWWGCLAAGVDTSAVWKFLGEDGAVWYEALNFEQYRRMSLEEIQAQLEAEIAELLAEYQAERGEAE